VFEGIASVFLSVEALVVNLPSLSSSFIGQGGRVGLGDPDVGDPSEVVGFFASCLLTFEDIELARVMVNVVDPPELLLKLVFFVQQVVFVVEEFPERLILPSDAGQSALLEGEDVFPVVLLAKLGNRATPVEGVSQDADGQILEEGFELGSETIKGRQLAVLDIRVGAGVLDEVGEHGESQAAGSDELDLKDKMVVGGLFGCFAIGSLDRIGLSQAVIAMALREAIGAGGVEDEEVPTAQKPTFLELSLTKEVPDELRRNGGEGLRRHLEQKVVECAGIGDPLLHGVGDAIEVLSELGCVELVVDAASASELQDEHEHSHPKQVGDGIFDLAGLTAIGELLKEGVEAPCCTVDCLEESFLQGSHGEPSMGEH
jgi:hypothetical protein